MMALVYVFFALWAIVIACAGCFVLFYLVARIFWLPFKVMGLLIDLPKLGWKVSSGLHF